MIQHPPQGLVEALPTLHQLLRPRQQPEGVLTLGGIGEDVLYFSDRPHRIVGRETLEKFLDAWDEGADSFEQTPPNAVLTVKQEDELRDLTVVLKNPVLTDGNLAYGVEVLDGPDAGSGEFAALFIDVIGDKSSLDTGHLLTSVVWDMTPVYIAMIEDLKGGTYGTKSYAISLADDSVKLLKTPQVPDEIWDEVMALREDIVSGKTVLDPVFDAEQVRALVTLAE